LCHGRFQPANALFHGYTSYLSIYLLQVLSGPSSLYLSFASALRALFTQHVARLASLQPVGSLSSKSTELYVFLKFVGYLATIAHGLQLRLSWAQAAVLVATVLFVDVTTMAHCNQCDRSMYLYIDAYRHTGVYIDASLDVDMHLHFLAQMPPVLVATVLFVDATCHYGTP
jgi:hypothetical protein